MRALIVNADDFGYDPAVTTGIAKSMREGIVTSTTMMVNTPFSEDAAMESSGLSIGLHLNLARHAPLSQAFPPSLLLRGELVEARAGELPVSVVAAELRAQLDRLQALIGRAATHIDVHKHLHRHPNVLQGIIEVARERRLPVRSIDDGMRQTLTSSGVVTNPSFIGDAGAEAYWTEAELEAQLKALPDGVTELMCHPGFTPSHTRSGYSAQREVELRTLTSRRAKELIAALGIQLVNYLTLKPSE